MIETEKKGSAWPWIAVPVAAVVVFFVLRECQHRLPAPEHAASPEVSVPAAPDQPASDPTPAAAAETAPAPEPAPQ